MLKQGEPYCIFKIEETISKPLTQIRYIPEGNQRKTRRKPANLSHRSDMSQRETRGKTGGNQGETMGKPWGNQRETRGKPE